MSKDTAKTPPPDRASPGKTANESEGRELDALIAERVMGWEWLETVAHDGVTRKAIFPPLSIEWVRINFSAQDWTTASDSAERFSDWFECCRRADRQVYGLPAYSTDIAAAMDVFEHLHRKGHMISVNASGEGNGYWCVIYPLKDGPIIETEYCESAAESICRAALAAITEAETKESV